MARPGSGSIPGSTCTLLLMMMLMLMLLHPSEAQPSPGYYPSKMFRSMAFYEGYSTLWGPQHQTLSQDQKSLTLWMDRSSGSGFKSTRSYRNGYFGASIRVQPGYTAGVNTAFYLSNTEQYPGHHDEIDMELLGTVPGEPYTLQTNVYVSGSGDGNIVGREMRFHSTPPPVSTTTPSSGTPTRSCSWWTTCRSGGTRRRWRGRSRSGRCGRTDPSGTPPTGPPTAAATAPTTATSHSSPASPTSRSAAAPPPRRRHAAPCRRRPAASSARSRGPPWRGRSATPWSTTTARITPGITPSTPSADEHMACLHQEFEIELIVGSLLR